VGIVRFEKGNAAYRRMPRTRKRRGGEGLAHATEKGRQSGLSREKREGVLGTVV